MDNTIQEERVKTAKYRFYYYILEKEKSYKHVIADREQEPKSIAKFKTPEDAELFLIMVRERYIRGEEVE